MGKTQSYFMLILTFLVLGLVEEVVIRLIMKSGYGIWAKVLLVMVAIGVHL